MRSVINISLPKSMADTVEKEVSAGRFATKSEFFRHVVRSWEENKLLKDLRESQKEIAEGKGKVLRSLRDLR